MPDFLISSLRGGLNEDAPISIADDQVTVASNIEWVLSPLGERRKGAVAIDLTGSGIETYSRVTWAHRHLPTTDLRDAQLWLLGVLDGAPDTLKLVYKDATGWHTVAQTDAIDPDYAHQVVGQSLHGKLFLAYKSSVDRLHVWDGTSLRRTGLAEPAAPAVANTGAGSYAGTRYFRVRYVTVSGTTVLRRSEPSDATTFAPSGTGASARITKPAAISEGETHWEVEESTDASSFYRIARVAVGTTTYDDSIAFAALASTSGVVLSADAGDYSLIPSVRYLACEQDRLMGAASFEDEALASRVMWTPVNGDPGDGNDERLELDTDPFKDLDNYDGGGITGLIAAVNGYVFAAKFSHLYQLSRSGLRTKAYDDVALTKERGAIEGSMVAALDNTGNPMLFAVDPDIGPFRFGPRGVEPCGLDLAQTFDTVNLNANVPCRAVYFAEKKQVHWFLATGASDAPDTRIVLHTRFMREAADGMRGGWAVWDGPSAAALAACSFAVNVDDMSSGASKVLAPIVCVEGDGLVWLTDEGDDDNGTDYFARIVTKPYVHASLRQFEIKEGSIMAKATVGATIDAAVIADFGRFSKPVAGISLAPVASETRVVRKLDNLSLAECRAFQIEIEDPAAPGAQWQLEQLFLREGKGGA